MRQIQQSLVFTLPAGQSHFSPKELAAISGHTPQHVRDCFAHGKIYGFESNGRADKGREMYKRKYIPRAAAALWLASISNCHPEEILALYQESFKPLRPEQLIQLRASIDRLMQLKQEGRVS